MRTREGKNGWALVLILLAGIVIGGFIGYHLVDVPFVGWLAYYHEFGISEPVKLDLGIIELRFGLMLRVNVAGVIGLLLGILLYKKTI
jgi:hypothetical protein